MRIGSYQVGDSVVYKGLTYQVEDIYAQVKSIQYNPDKNYIRAIFSDNKGRDLSVAYFSNDPNVLQEDSSLKLKEIVEGDYVHILGFTYLYGTLNCLNPIGGYDKLDTEIQYENAYKKDFKQKIDDIISLVQNEKLKAICNKLLEDKKEFYFKPAATSHHHNYVGGLVQHTCEVMLNASAMATFYNVNRDIVIVASLFHDIMKIEEYDINGNMLEYGNMIGHISGSASYFESLANEFGLDEDLKLQVKHCILAHHGQKEWGSPVEPRTMEAAIVFCADLCSARINALRNINEEDSSYYNK